MARRGFSRSSWWAGSWALGVGPDWNKFGRDLCAGYIALLRQPASHEEFCGLEPFAGSSPAANAGSSAGLEGALGKGGCRQPDPRQQKTGETPSFGLTCFPGNTPYALFSSRGVRRARMNQHIVPMSRTLMPSQAQVPRASLGTSVERPWLVGETGAKGPEPAVPALTLTCLSQESCSLTCRKTMAYASCINRGGALIHD